MKACSSTSWWKYNKKNGSVKQKVNLQRYPPSQVQEMKRGRVNGAETLAAPRQEARATAVEAFDVRVLINEDYGLCACVSPDLSTSARRRQHSRKTSDKTAPRSKGEVAGQYHLHPSNQNTDVQNGFHT